MISKKTIRKHALEKRAGFTAEKIKEDSNKILHRIKKLNLSAQIIHLFLPIKNSTEIDTWQILKLLLNNNKVATSITHFKPKRLDHTFINLKTTYDYDKYGIPVPKEIVTLKEEIIDVVFVPLLICDTQGNRIGYGAGFYDSFLAKCSPDCKKIGLSFFEPLETTIKSDVWDIPLDLLITPNTTISF